MAENACVNITALDTNHSAGDLSRGRERRGEHFMSNLLVHYVGGDISQARERVFHRLYLARGRNPSIISNLSLELEGITIDYQSLCIYRVLLYRRNLYYRH